MDFFFFSVQYLIFALSGLVHIAIHSMNLIAFFVCSVLGFFYHYRLKQIIVLKNTCAFLLQKTTHSITEMERTIKYGIRGQCHVLPNEHVSSLEA